MHIESVFVLHRRSASTKIYLKLREEDCLAIFGRFHEFNHGASLGIDVPREQTEDALKVLGVDHLPREVVEM